MSADPQQADSCTAHYVNQWCKKNSYELSRTCHYTENSKIENVPF